jgi:ribonuclease HI
MYALNCASKWGPGWKRTAWRRASGEPLQNLDLIKPLVELWQAGRWPLVHVYGHQKGNGWQAYGNNWVDQAAVAASQGSVVALTATVYEPPAPPAPKLLVASGPPSPVAMPPPAVPPLKSKTVRFAGQTDLRKWFSEG